jgi:hypothetical protein
LSMFSRDVSRSTGFAAAVCGGGGDARSTLGTSMLAS